MIPTTAFTRLDLSMLQGDFDNRMDREGFITHRVLPILGKRKNFGQYPRLKRGAMLSNLKDTRGPRGQYSRSNTKFEFDTYKTQERGAETALDDRELGAYDDILDAEYWETERIIDGVLRNYEKRGADKIFDTSFFPNDAVGTSWKDLENSNVPSDIRERRETIFLACGYEPNALIVNREVFRWIRDSSAVIDKIKAQNFQDVRPSEISAAQLAQSLDIDMVIVAGSTKNDAPVNSGSPDFQRIYPSTRAMLAKVCMGNGDPAEIGIGKTVQWTQEGYRDGDRMGVLVEEYREEGTRGSVIRVRTDYDFKLDYAECGFVFTGVNA